MKITAIQPKCPAFKGFERVVLKSSFINSGSFVGLISDYATKCHKGVMMLGFNDFQHKMQNNMIEVSKRTGFSDQWYIENLKRHGAKVPKDFMSGRESVILAAGIEDMSKLRKFTNKTKLRTIIDTVTASVRYVFSPKYKNIPEDNRYYYAMMGVLDKHNARTDMFLAKNNVQDITVDQILSRIINSQ